jgi:hypothetical protein
MINTVMTLIPLLAGVGLLIAGVVLIFLQPATWKHLFVLSLGAVLAGVSGVQFTVNDEGVSATIGQSITQLKEASDTANTASVDLASAVTSLSMRVSELETALQQTAKAGTPAGEAVVRAGRLSADVTRLLNQSRLNSARAKDMIARTPIPLGPASRLAPK